MGSLMYQIAAAIRGEMRMSGVPPKQITLTRAQAEKLAAETYDARKPNQEPLNEEQWKWSTLFAIETGGFTLYGVKVQAEWWNG